MTLFSKRTVRSQLLIALTTFCPMVAVMANPGIAAAQEAAGSANGGRSDAVIESDILSALSSSSVLKGQRITAATIQGNVTLSGNVNDAASKELAEAVVLRVMGVNAVSNNLTVGSQPAGDTDAQTASSDGQQLPPLEDNAQGGAPNSPQEMQQQETQQSYPQQPGMQQPDVQQPYPRRDDMRPDGQDSQGYSGPRAPYGAPSTQYPSNRGPEQARSGPVQIPQGTLLRVRLSEFLDARRAQQGTMFEATAAGDVYSGSILAIPRGAVLNGQVVQVNSPKGSLGGSASMTLKLSTLQLGGQSYALDTDVWSGNGQGKGGYTASNTVGGAAVGAIIGGIAGGGTGAAIGAAAGGATGVAASAATSGPRLVLPPETVLTFHLANALTVTPVSYQEAQRLATASQQGRPGMGRRPGYRGYPGGNPGYGYPGYGYPGYPPPPVAYGYPYGPYYYPHYRGNYYGGYFGR